MQRSTLFARKFYQSAEETGRRQAFWASVMGAPQQGGELPLALPTATISTGGVVMPVAAAVPIRPVGLRINASCGPAAGGNQPAGVIDYVADGPTPDSQLSSPEDEDEGEEGSSTCWKKNVWTQEEDAHLLSLIKGFAGKARG